jgi:hypothetical protein
MTRTYLPRAFAAGARMLVDCPRRPAHSTARPVNADVTYGDGTGSRTDRPSATCSCAAVPSRRPRCCSARASTAHRPHARRPPDGEAHGRFADEVNVPDDVPVHQVKEFAPDLSFGGSASHSGLVALALTRPVATFRDAGQQWRA